MTDLQIYLTIGVFAGVILAIAFDLMDMAVAALLGVCVLLALGLLDSNDLLAAAVTAGGPLSLLFGGMVVARVLARTGVFDCWGTGSSAPPGAAAGATCSSWSPWSPRCAPSCPMPPR